MPRSMVDPADRLAAALDAAHPGLVLALTGAGVSAPSGLPTFRSGTDAIWRRDDVEIGTAAFFRADPVAHWRWYLDRFAGILDAAPNDAHHALAAIERWQTGRGGRFLLVTQNIDVLHEAAGSTALIKVHGTADRLRCSRSGCVLGAPLGSLPRAEVELAPFVREPSLATLPRCPACEAPMRAHALFFDEYYDDHADYAFARVQAALEEISLVLFVGTSFSVGVTELALRAALFGKVPAFSIDPGGTSGSYPWLTELTARAEELLPAVCRQLGAELAPPATGAASG